MDQTSRRQSRHGPLLSSSTALRGWLGALIIGISMLISNCGGVILVGAGVGAGAFSYFAGNVIRVYEAGYQQSIEASTRVMEQFVFKGKEETEDGVKTVIEGYFDYDTPVTIEVVSVDSGSTQIGVRTGYFGNDNLEISEQLHTDISGELGKLAASTPQVQPQEEKVSEPVILKATSHKKKVQPAGDRVRISRTLYDDLPPPPKSGSSSTAGATNMPSIDLGPETHNKAQTENEQEATEQLQARIEETELDVGSPMSQPVAAPRDSDMDESDKRQGPFISESTDKTFMYHPESERTIHSGSYRVLDEVVAYLDNKPSTRVDIRAYINSSSNEDRDIALTQKRVFEIRNYLILNGISEERISAQGLGESDFPEINSQDRQQAQNHPVEMIVK
jgi:outer membrane protein OmpA-like peptidoglycan-associated protein